MWNSRFYEAPHTETISLGGERSYYALAAAIGRHVVTKQTSAAVNVNTVSTKCALLNCYFDTLSYGHLQM